MTTPQWTSDPVLAAAVERLRGLLVERGCYAASLRVFSGSLPELAVQGHGVGAGQPTHVSDDGKIGYWTVRGSDGVAHTVSGDLMAENAALRGEVAALMSEIESRRARDAALLTAPTGPVSGPDEVTARMAAVEERP